MMLPSLRIITTSEDNVVEVERDRLVALAPVEKGEGNSLLTPIYVAIRASGEFAGRALYLGMECEWVLGLDSEGCIILVPLKAEGSGSQAVGDDPGGEGRPREGNPGIYDPSA